MAREQGYQITIHKSLTEPIMMGGVPRNMAIVNATIGAAFGIGGKTWYVIPIFIFLHICLRAAHKKDHQYLYCLARFFALGFYKKRLRP